MTTRTLEAVTPEQRRAYRAEVERILDTIDSTFQVDADRETLELFSELRRDVVATIADLGDSPSAALYQRTLAGIDASMRAWAERFGIRVDLLAERGFELGEELVTGPLAAAGAEVSLGGSGPTTDTLRTLAQLRQDYVGGITDDLRRRIRLEVAGVATGAQTAQDAVEKIGRNLTDRNHFSTLMHRARAIVVTEVGRAQAVAAQAAQNAAAQQIPGLRKRWINAHLPGARETHLQVEADTRPGGDPGPIPVDAEFTVAGEQALYPRDPSLSAKESVNCHCVTITVIADTELAKEGEPVHTNDETPIELAGPDTPDSIEDLSPAARRRLENRERIKRLEQPLTPPDGFGDWPKTRQRRWIENEMENDWPIGEEWRDEVIVQRSETVTMSSGRKRRRKIRERVPTAGIGEDLPTTFDLAVFDPGLAIDHMNELRRLGTRYPQVAEQLSYVGTYRGGDKALRWKQSGRWASNTYAHASVDGRRLAYNPAQFGDAEMFRGNIRSDAKLRPNGLAYHPTIDGTAVTTHEFGHHVDFWLRRNGDADVFGFNAVPDTQDTITGFDSIVSRFIQFRGVDTNGRREISIYAQASQAEGWAESFSAVEIRRKWAGRRISPMVDLSGAAQKWIDDLDVFLEGVRDLDLDNRPRYESRFRAMTNWDNLSAAEKVAYYERQNEITERLGLDISILPRGDDLEALRQEAGL